MDISLLTTKEKLDIASLLNSNKEAFEILFDENNIEIINALAKNPNLPEYMFYKIYKQYYNNAYTLGLLVSNVSIPLDLKEIIFDILEKYVQEVSFYCEK